MSEIRVLQVLGCLDRGGAENMIMSVYRNIDREKIQFDFILHLNRKSDFDDEAKSLGARIFYAPQYNGKNHFEYKKWWNDFFKEHPEYKILHSHVRSTAVIYTKIAKKYGVKTIVHSHNSSNIGGGIKAMVKDLYQRNITKYADKCLVCSEKAGEWLFKGHEYTLYKNTIDAKKFTYNIDADKKLREQYGFTDEFIIGHVGRFHEQKNHKFLMDIFASILEKEKNAVLVLVGEKIGSIGFEKQELLDYAKKKGIDHKCVFAGNVPNVYDYLSMFDAFVFPSLHEGLPVTLIEAQASGLECFVSDAVSEESKITDNIQFIPLDKGAEYWAEAVLSCKGKERKDTYDQIYDSGYDVEAGAKIITEIYMSLLNK